MSLVRASVSPPPGLPGEADADRETSGGLGDDAICELFAQYSADAWGVAYAVLRNRDDANDAVSDAYTKLLASRVTVAPREFRSYFLRVAHNAAVDIQRRSQRVAPGAVEDRPGPERDGPGDAVLADEDRTLVASAFAGVPARWREALWLIDVEGLSTREAGAVLGVSATNAAQLAARGRGRLREQYMQAHVPNHVAPACATTVELLGRYAAGALSTSKRLVVDRHVSGCDACAHRLTELDDLGVKLRRAIPPLPIGLGWGTRGRFSSLFDLIVRQAGPAAAQATSLAGGTPVVERIAAGAAATVLAVGLSTLAVRGGGASDTADRAGGGTVAATSEAGSPPPPAAQTSGGANGTPVGLPFPLPSATTGPLATGAAFAPAAPPPVAPAPAVPAPPAPVNLQPPVDLSKVLPTSSPSQPTSAPSAPSAPSAGSPLAPSLSTVDSLLPPLGPVAPPPAITSAVTTPALAATPVPPPVLSALPVVPGLPSQGLPSPDLPSPDLPSLAAPLTSLAAGGPSVVGALTPGLPIATPSLVGGLPALVPTSP